MISSPCTGICTLDAAARFCLGCGRSLEQIGGWSTLSEAERQAIMQGLADPPSRERLHGAPVSR